MKIAVVQGSARSKGDTFTILQAFKAYIDFDVFDLKKYNIGYYDYNHQQNDDFLSLMKALVKYDLIILATPVYWYSMSGRMKVFLDRITDCLKIEKETGRQLRGKGMAVISCSNSNDLQPDFDKPLSLSAEYLGMNYQGHIHCWIESKISDEVLNLIRNFSTNLISVNKNQG